jgi:hypothetical protein
MNPGISHFSLSFFLLKKRYSNGIGGFVIFMLDYMTSYVALCDTEWFYSSRDSSSSWAA